MKIQFQNKDLIVFESALYRTTSSIISLGESILIIDPNWLPHEVYFIRNFVEQKFSGKKQYLLFTHSDYDHIIGWKAFPNAITIASDSFTENGDKEEVIRKILEFDNNYYIQRDYEIAYPDIDIIIGKKESDTLSINNIELHFFSAKGHNSDGIFTLIPDLQIWIAGDYLSNVEIPMIDYDFTEYQKTLVLADKILKIKHPKFLVPGHGDLTTNGSQIAERIQSDLQYIRLLSDHAETDVIKKFVSTYYNPNPALMEIHANNIKKILNM